MKILVSIFAYNEGVKIRDALSRFSRKREYDILVVDDGSTDDTINHIRKFENTKILRNERNLGIGASIRNAFKYAIENEYDITVCMAGNNKDEPSEIPSLIEPIIKNGYHFVQGSRYLKGGGFGRMPIYRLLATRYIHPFIFTLVSGKRITDSTNGFRAISTLILKDKRINLNQQWLNKYELEPYLFYKAIKLGYKVKEIPVTKIYPPKQLGYTKMKPFTGWWSILRPLIYLNLGIKK